MFSFADVLARNASRPWAAYPYQVAPAAEVNLAGPIHAHLVQDAQSRIWRDY
jgi:hypothetical protein